MRLSALLLLAACDPVSDRWSGGASADTASAGDWSESDADTDADWAADTGDVGDTDDDTDTADTGDTGEACDDAAPVTLYLSPDDSNSMSSPVQVRDAVMGGWTNLRGVPIRTWEFLNYYSFDYPKPETGLLVTPLLQRTADDTFVLQIGVSSPARSNAEREPINLVLSLDTSGSMGGEPLRMAKATIRAIAASLRAGDVVSAAEWSNSNAVLLEEHTVVGPDDPTLLALASSLNSNGGTNLEGGLVAAYDIASRTYDPARINRVVLISDGGANIGVTSEELIGRHAGEGDEEGIYLVGVGVGTANTYNDKLMDEVTDLGRGASVFITTEDEAWAQFGPDGFVRTMDVAYRDVGVQLDLPPGFEIVRFSGEEYSTDHREIEPQHIAPDDTVVFYQTLATCAPELATGDATLRVSVRYQDPRTWVTHTTTVEATFDELGGGDLRLLDKGAAVYAYAEALKACQNADNRDWPTILGPARTAVQRALLSNPSDPDLLEILGVIAALGG